MRLPNAPPIIKQRLIWINSVSFLESNRTFTINKHAITETINNKIELEKGFQPNDIPSLVMCVKYNNLGIITIELEFKGIYC